MRRLIGGDYANVEGRVNAWLSGEAWKLQAFREYDAGIGPDLYKVAYSRAFGEPVATIGKGPKRQIGKVSELALGYQGGVGAYVTMGDTYGVKPAHLVRPVMDATPSLTWDAAQAKYESATDKHGLPELQWTAIKIIVLSWRNAHPATVKGWYEIGDAAVQAVLYPDVPVWVYGGRVAYLSSGGTLWCQLPSGRLISYIAPEVIQQDEERVKIPEGQQLLPHFSETGWIDLDRFFPHEIEILRKAGAEFWKLRKNTVRFMGVDGETKQWRHDYLYGGKQCENIVSGTARCLLDHAALRLEDLGYPVTLTVHDEILAEPALSEVPGFVGSVQEFIDVMAVPMSWTAGLPTAVSAWEGKRWDK